MTELEQFRAEKDEFFRDHPQSPLEPAQRKVFTGLNYFPENEALRLEVKVGLLNDPNPIQMQTTTGGAQIYQRYGRFKFSVDGEEAELTIYKADYGHPAVLQVQGSDQQGRSLHQPVNPQMAGSSHNPLDRSSIQPPPHPPKI